MVNNKDEEGMGWAKGSYIAIELWDTIRRDIPKDKRQRVAKKIYNIFCSEDADDWCGDSSLEKDADIIYREEG